MTAFSAADSRFMARALRLAERGRLTAAPNPMVGCVLVRDGDIVGEGYHLRAGEAHAEVNAIADAGERTAGATAYVTLEPCAVTGRTPPCTEALIEAGVAEVVIAAADPSPSAASAGLKRLEAAGIAVRQGLMAAQSETMNRGFLMRVSRGRPFVTLKLAVSIDGAIAMQSGESQWITGPAARADVQRLRAESAAILTGIGTVIDDDPSLTVRDERFDTARQPLRVVVDSTARLPSDARVRTQAGDLLQVTARDGEGDLSLSDTYGRVDLGRLMQALGERDINTLLVECGPRLAGNLLDADLVDELVIYQAPHMMGSETRRMARTPGWQQLSDRLDLEIVDRRQVGRDTRITARIS
ncbi:MAG: bifunctional diaminohydroxyphosphoribosylaminopyrimidine deaminase/5-amino-6-(5-phosphoribosylamino)uracil reductase RibD [Pseudomonadota bacterium]